MTDLFTAAVAPEEALSEPAAQPLTVSEISNQLRFAVESQFANIQVLGEVATLRQPASGHIYFNLKDETNVLKGVIWRSTAARLNQPINEGQQVIATGKLSTYGPRSEYQLIINKVEPAGQGALLQLLEERKAKLAAEGLFDEDRKQPLPLLPQRLGIITSPTGAVIEDMLHRLADRCPREIILAGARVQGEGAAAELREALLKLQNLPTGQRPDVIIMARGGGSLEDLWEFNDETLVRAIAECDIPVITGVGHEPDVTLVDYVADVRAPTPTAAIEFAVPVRHELLVALQGAQQRLAQQAQQVIRFKQQRVDYALRGLPQPQELIHQALEQVTQAEHQLRYAAQQQVKSLHQQIQQFGRLLLTQHPDQVLQRGFATVQDTAGNYLESAQQASGTVQVAFKDGQRTMEVKV